MIKMLFINEFLHTQSGMGDQLNVPAGQKLNFRFQNLTNFMLISFTQPVLFL